MGRTKDGGQIVHIGAFSAGVLAGEIDLSDFDDDELIAGRKKDKGGKFRGRPLKLIPAEYMRELQRRRFSRAWDVLESSLVDGARLLASIIRDPEASDSDRLRATEILFDRVLGRPRERVQLNLDGEPSRWERLLMTAIVATDDQAANVVEGEVVDEGSD